MFVLLFAVARPTAFLLQNFKKRFVCSFERDKGKNTFFRCKHYLHFFRLFSLFLHFFSRFIIFISCFVISEIAKQVFLHPFSFSLLVAFCSLLERLPYVCSFRSFGSCASAFVRCACIRFVRCACIRFRSVWLHPLSFGVFAYMHTPHTPTRTDTPPSAARGHLRESGRKNVATPRKIGG